MRRIDTAWCIIASLSCWQGTALLAQTTGNPTRWQAQYSQVYYNDLAAASPGSNSAGPGLVLWNGATITTDPAVVIGGNTSIRLTNGAYVSTDPAVVPLAGNSTYIVQLQYRLLSTGGSTMPLAVWFNPAGNATVSASVNGSPLLQNASVTGTFSSGAQLAGAASWVLNIGAGAGTDVAINGVTIFQQTAPPTSTQPPSWSRLTTLPYPRLGLIMAGDSVSQAEAGGLAEGPPLRLTVNQIESTLAFADVIAGLEDDTQTQFPDSIWRIRQLNPNAIILPHITESEQVPPLSAIESATNSAVNATIYIDQEWYQGMADSWYLRDSNGNYVATSGLNFMNISPYCPVVAGQTFVGSEVDWLTGTMFPSGVWDGAYLNDLFASAVFGYPNVTNPALFNVDFEGNGIPESPAEASDFIRAGATNLVQQIQSADGGQQLIMGNNGPLPELSLAPYINGYEFECADFNWDPSIYLQTGNISQAGWRTFLDAYQSMQATARIPRINLVMGCGVVTASQPSTGYSTPTANDLQNHRLTMATTLLDDGFYGFDLHDEWSAPLWMDEYSVDSSGTAVEDMSKKGYLGNALTGATQLAAPGPVFLQENFESGVVPSIFNVNNNQGGSVYVSQSPGDVIDGSASLVISNPNHTQQTTVGIETNPNLVQFSPGNYLVTFDWRVLQTLDWVLGVDIVDYQTRAALDTYNVLGRVTGDHGTATIPFTVPGPGTWTFNIYLVNGGEVAIDNLTIAQGGVGPWRRDFQNGFVLVNPLQQAYTFSAADLAGSLNRTGIHRISGTQAPDINNGQAVTDELTIASFDAIILLANTIPTTAITIQTSPAGLQFSVDGGPAQTAPQTLNLVQGPHTIAAATPQAGATGTQYVLTSWSDGATTPADTITVGTSAATYTATFQTQYQLTISASPPAGGTVTPASGSFYNAGAAVPVVATPNAGYMFNSWTGAVPTPSSASTTVIMNAPETVTADFSVGSTSCSISLTPNSASVPATGTSTVETCPNNSGQPNCGVLPEVSQSFTVTPSASCGAWTAASSNPAILAVTSGGAGSGAGTVSYTLLNNTHTGTQTYSITVSSGAASATYPVTEAGSGDSKTYREVFALYEQLLGRDPDSGGFAFWSGSGGAGLGQMADSFLTSPEAFNSDFVVMAAYQAATGSAPTYA
ncbi:MAG TPA: hypothetical protein VME43_22535, partial [Bryobacteraceae bacterium]|nr:hypothetical protein [Bryobacteraceae bacterium]